MKTEETENTFQKNETAINACSTCLNVATAATVAIAVGGTIFGGVVAPVLIVATPYVILYPWWK